MSHFFRAAFWERLEGGTIALLILQKKWKLRHKLGAAAQKGELGQNEGTDAQKGELVGLHANQRISEKTRRVAHTCGW